MSCISLRLEFVSIEVVDVVDLLVTILEFSNAIASSNFFDLLAIEYRLEVEARDIDEDLFPTRACTVAAALAAKSLLHNSVVGFPFITLPYPPTNVNIDEMKEVIKTRINLSSYLLMQPQHDLYMSSRL